MQYTRDLQYNLYEGPLTQKLSKLRILFTKKLSQRQIINKFFIKIDKIRRNSKI